MPAEPAPGQAAADGQRAYEASIGIIRADFDGPPWAWDDLPPRHRAAFDAAAAAVAAPLNAEIASLREQLAEQSRQRDGLLGRVNDLAADVEALQDDNASLREQLDRLRIAATDLRRRLDDLASWWEHEYASETGWPSRCARELREALQGGGDGD